MHLIVLLYLALVTCYLGCMTNDTRSGRDSIRIDLGKLPQTLEDLQKATGYQNWESLRGYSRSLTHYRQVRIQKGANVFISETGPGLGQVDVVEVILMPSATSEVAEFALYDPESGNRIERYPDSVRFEAEGIHGDSDNPAPSLCHACHAQRMPLNTFVPRNKSMELRLKRARAAGQGIRSDLFEPETNDETTRNRITRFNAIMKTQFPDRVSDVREWMWLDPTRTQTSK